MLRVRIDAMPQTAHDSPMFRHSREDSRGKWIPILIAAIVIGAALAAILLLAKQPRPQVQQSLDPYAENLQVGDLKLSVAESFSGASVHYVEGKIANTGGRTANGIQVEALFRDSMGQVVLRDTQSLMLLQRRSGDLPPETVALKSRPLQPNEVQEFRLTFEHLPSEWNGGYPELRFVKISLQ